MSKKIIISLVIIGISASFIIGGTFAYFSDTETSEDNTLAAGTMDLDIDGGDIAVQTMNLSNKAPGNSGSESSSIKNAGSLDGELDILTGQVANYACAPDGSNDGTEYCTTDPGVLGANTEMALYVDVDENDSWNSGDIGLKSDGNTYDTTGSLEYDIVDNYSNQTWDDVYGGLMAVNDQDGFIIDWKVLTSATNDIQGDKLDFDVTFVLEQADKD